MNTETRDWITAAEAAEILEVHPRTVIRWAENGVFRVTRSGPAKTNPWLVSRADVEAHKAKAGAR